MSVLSQSSYASKSTAPGDGIRRGALGLPYGGDPTYGVSALIEVARKFSPPFHPVRTQVEDGSWQPEPDRAGTHNSQPPEL